MKEKANKVNEQRFALVLILCNILDTEKGVSDKIKSATAASMLNMIETSMIPGDDEPLIELMNNSIDTFCKNIEEKHGVENYRERLMETVRKTREMVDALKEKLERIKDGEDILKNICLN